MSQFAPFGTLFRYFALRFAGWVCFCLFGLVSIISLIQTIELVRRVSVLTRTVPDINYVGMGFENPECHAYGFTFRRFYCGHIVLFVMEP